MGPGRCRKSPVGGGSRSTGREGGTRETSSSVRRRLAVHREGGWDRNGVVILRAAEPRGPLGRTGGSRSTWREGGTGETSSSGRRRLAVHQEGGWDRNGVVILRAAEARGPLGRTGGSRSTWREGGTGETSSSGRRRLAVHQEGGWDRNGVVILRAAEARGPPGGRAGTGTSGRRHPPGGGGTRSTGRKGGTGEASSSSGVRRLAVHPEGGWVGEAS